jgi:hypothetical protein
LFFKEKRGESEIVIVVYIHTHQVAEFFVSVKFGNGVVALRKTLTLTLSAETITLCL